MPDVGDTLAFSASLYDKDPTAGGVLVNAVTAALTLTLPDGTTTSPTVTNPPTTTGLYSYQYPTTVPGRHTGRWLFTLSGGNTVAHTETFTVSPSDPGDLVSLAQVKAHLGKTSTADDEELRLYLAAATDMIEAEVGAVVRRTRTDVVCGTYDLWLPVAPVISVTSIVGQRYATSVLPADVTAEQWGRVYRTSGTALGYTDAWIVTYTVGRTVIPPSMTLAALMLVGHLWETQRGGADLPLSDADTGLVPGFGFAMPNRVRELLAPYAKPAAVA